MEIGLFVKCPHPEMIEAIALSGMDFAVVDMEHTPLSPRDIYPLVLAAEGRDLPLVVRVPKNDEEYIKWCVDLGVRRIQIPNIRSAADVEAAVKSSYFHPQGSRGLCRFVRAADFSVMKSEFHISSSNVRTELILQIEGLEALESIDQIIAAAPENSIIFVGPWDLSQAFGKPGEVMDPQVLYATNHVRQKCSAAGLRFGTFTDSSQGLDGLMRAGTDLIEFASDLAVFIKAAAAIRGEALSA